MGQSYQTSWDADRRMVLSRLEELVELTREADRGVREQDRRMSKLELLIEERTRDIRRLEGEVDSARKEQQERGRHRDQHPSEVAKENDQLRAEVATLSRQVATLSGRSVVALGGGGVAGGGVVAGLIELVRYLT